MLAAAAVDWVNAAIDANDRRRAAALAGSALAVLAILAGTFMLRRAISGAPGADGPDAVAPLRPGIARVAGAHPRTADSVPVDGLATSRRVQQALCAGALLMSAASYWLAFANPDALWRIILDTVNERLPFLPVSAATPPPVMLGLMYVLPHAYLGFAYRSPLLVRVRHRVLVTLAGGLVGFVSGYLIGFVMTALAHRGAFALSLEGYVTFAPVASSPRSRSARSCSSRR